MKRVQADRLKNAHITYKIRRIEFLKDIKNDIIIAIIVIAIGLFAYWVIKTEYGNLSNWWNQETVITE